MKDELLQFAISGSDPDSSGTLTFAATDLPSGAVFDPTTRQFSWTPTLDQAGKIFLVVSVTDNGYPPLTASEIVEISVRVNQPPVLNLIGNKQVEEGQVLEFTISGPPC